MFGSRIIQGFGARIIVLLALGLLTVGCAEQSVEQLLADARQERDKGHYQTAVLHLKNVLQKSPEHAEARYLMGVTLNDMGDFKAAEIELRKAIDLRYELAKVKIGKPLLMMREYQKVLDQIPLDSTVSDAVQGEILTLRAQALMGLRRHREASELLEKALAKQPEFPDALLAQARLMVVDRKPDEAAKLIDHAIAVAPKNVDAWLMKGDLATFRKDTAGATAANLKVLELSPENFRARLYMTSLQIEAGKLDEARKHLDQFRKLAPRSHIVKYFEGLIEFHQRKFTAARDAALQSLKTAPDYVPSHMLAGTARYALGEHVQVQSHLMRVVEYSPGYLYARLLLVSSLAKTGQVQRAIELLQPGLQQAPEDISLLGLAGEVYLQNNEFAKAVGYFGRAAKLDPKSEGARIGMALSRIGAGETDKALADLESAVELDPYKYRADLLLITTHLQRGDYDLALKAMQTLEKKQPKNPLTYSLKAAIYLGKRDQAAGRKHLEHALELNPTYVPAARNLALLDLLDKKPAVARRRLEAILEKDKDNTQALLTLAGLAPQIAATSKEQIDWLERARKASPRSAQAQVMLARAYADSRDSKRALEVAQQAQSTHPDNTEVLEILGTLQMDTGAKQQALTTFNRLVTLQPMSAVALFRLATAQVANADHRKAETTLRKALSLRPDFIEAQMALGTLDLTAGRHAAALKTAQQLQKQSPKAPAGFILEGDVMAAEKKFLQAAKAYETAYDMNKDGAVLTRLHAAYTMAGKADEADRHLAQGLKESPDNVAVRAYAASASVKSGKYKDAIEQYEWLLKKQPDDVLLLNNLAWVYQQTRDPRALETAERAYKLQPGNPAAADTLGWMLVEEGNTKRGIELLQKAVTAAPKVSEHRLHLARAFVKVGDRARAKEELEILLKNAPSSRFTPEAKQLLEELRR